MEAIDVFETTAVDVGADRLSCAVMPMARCAPGSTAVRSARPWTLRYKLSHPPHVGTPGALPHRGNSTPPRALVAGAGKSPVFGPVSGK